MTKKGFTLIEMLIVVVIIGVISAIVIPAMLGMLEKSKPNTIPIPHQGQSSLRPSAADNKNDDSAVPATTDSAVVNVKLVAKNYLYRLKVYTFFDADFEGDFVFINPSPEKPVKLYFPFPEGTTQARNVSLKFYRQDGSLTEPNSVIYTLNGILWYGALGQGERLRAKATYGAQGYNRFAYEGPGAGRAGAFKMSVSLEGVTEEFISADTLQPTTVQSGFLQWDYKNLVTNRRVIVELPGEMSPMGRIMLLSELAAVAILFFGLGFLYLSELKEPGRLDNFRLPDFLLLAFNYFLFFIIFMVLSLNGDLALWVSMGLSAAVSLPLLMIHASRILDKTFAFTRVLPLALFTLSIVINGVYGGAVMKYIYIGLTALTVAILTLTYQTWTEKRKEYRLKRAAEKEAQRKHALQSIQSSTESLHCCLYCGASSLISSYCPHCGALKPIELHCTKCNDRYKLPTHLSTPEKIARPLYCMGCGQQYPPL
jgi:prepilin-type N-terminal cleavage/methylation domain-containing protein